MRTMWPFSWAYRKGYRAAREAESRYEIECRFVGGEMDGRILTVQSPAPARFHIPKFESAPKVATTHFQPVLGQLIYERQNVVAEYR